MTVLIYRRHSVVQICMEFVGQIVHRLSSPRHHFWMRSELSVKK